MFALYKRILGKVSRRIKWKLVLLFGLIIFAMFTEVLTLGAIVPFLTVLADPLILKEKFAMYSLIKPLGSLSNQDLRIYLTAGFVIAAFVSGLVRLLVIYVSVRTTEKVSVELASAFYTNALHQPFEVQIRQNSSEIVGGIGKVDKISTTIQYGLNFLSSSFMAIGIIVSLLVINLNATIISMGCISLIYGSFILATKRKLSASSRAISENHDRRIKFLQEGIGSIRDILMDSCQPLFVSKFTEVDRRLRRAESVIAILGPSPRYVIETLGMMLIAILAFKMSGNGNGLATAIPTIAILTLGGQRLIPLIQQMHHGLAMMATYKEVILDFITSLDRPLERINSDGRHTEIGFDSEVVFENMSFAYEKGDKPLLEIPQLKIRKGARIGVVGSTGSGKSTLLDLLMGLLEPTTGGIYVDGVLLGPENRSSWRSNIAHVPQQIFLLDDSITRNIAFGVKEEKIDFGKVQEAARLSELDEFIEDKLAGFETIVGERGVSLSGGQCQRIGIARAMYKKAPILILDEATSALDEDTEERILKNLQQIDSNITVIMITHRKSTLKYCDSILTVKDGRVELVKGSIANLITIDQ